MSGACRSLKKVWGVLLVLIPEHLCIPAEIPVVVWSRLLKRSKIYKCFEEVHKVVLTLKRFEIDDFYFYQMESVNLFTSVLFFFIFKIVDENTRWWLLTEKIFDQNRFLLKKSFKISVWRERRRFLLSDLSIIVWHAEFLFHLLCDMPDFLSIIVWHAQFLFHLLCDMPDFLSFIVWHARFLQRFL